MTDSGKIFNVDADNIGTQHQTTAAEAQIDAPTRKVAAQVEKNADRLKHVAQQTATAAKDVVPGGTGEPPSATDELQKQVRATTEKAVEEGKHDVAAAKATGGTYLEQASSIATNALHTAQDYLPASVQSHLPSSVGSQTSASSSATTTTSGSALDTAKEYIASAQAAIQPRLDAAAATAQPHIKKAADTAQNYLPASVKPHIDKYLPTGSNANGTPASSIGIPATSAPLETGSHTANTANPPTSTKTGANASAATPSDVGK